MIMKAIPPSGIIVLFLAGCSGGVRPAQDVHWSAVARQEERMSPPQEAPEAAFKLWRLGVVDRQFGGEVWQFLVRFSHADTLSVVVRLGSRGLRPADLMMLRTIAGASPVLAETAGIRGNVRQWLEFIRRGCGNGIAEACLGFGLLGLLLQHRSSCLQWMGEGIGRCGRDGLWLPRLRVDRAEKANLVRGLCAVPSQCDSSLLESLCHLARECRTTVSVDHLCDSVVLK